MLKSYVTLFLALFIVASDHIWSYQAALTHESEQAIERAQHLQTRGRLKQGPDGYVYLKLPNQFVYALFPLVREPGFELPWHIRRHTRVGAHISVMYKDEGAFVGPISELGQTFQFFPKRIKTVRAGRKMLIILQLEAPELEKLRMRYGLSPKIMGNEFHVTLAEKYLY